MFSNDAIFKMLGISKEEVQQITALQTLLNKLPKEKRVELITEFVEKLQNTIKEVESPDKEDK